MIVESGALRQADGAAEISGSFPVQEIPATLQDLLMARLDRMASNIDVMQLAATLGREFTLEVIRAVSPLPDLELEEELNKLVESEMLNQRGRAQRTRYQFKHALIQDAAYQSLVKNKRQQFHGVIANTYESQFPEIVQQQPELLGHHFSEADDANKAISYWLKAGKRAVERSANAESLDHLSRGLALIDDLDEGSDADGLELDLRVARAVPLTATQGYVAKDVETEYLRARDLATGLSDVERLLPVLHGLYRYYVVQADNQKAIELGEAILQSSEQLNDPEHVMEANRSLCLTLSFVGRFNEVLQHATTGLDFYDATAHAGHKFVYGADPGMIFLTFQSWALWNLGLPDQTYDSVQQAFEHTETIRHPHSRAFCLSFCCGTLFNLGLWDECQEAAEEAINISSEHGFPFWLGNGNIMKGGSLIKSGQVDEGVPLIVEGLSKFEKSGVGMWRPTHLAILAEGYQQQDRSERAMKSLDLALEIARRRQGDAYEAELHRLKGEFTLAGDSTATTDAEASFQTALDVARQQNSRMFELRAMTSLAQLRKNQGNVDEAKAALTELVDSFIEGHKTHDLIHARDVLDQL